MNLEERLHSYTEQNPNIHILSPNKSETEDYLKKKEWIQPGNTIKRLEKPGEGNMNLLVRVILENEYSFILKQARPWVEKFPQIDAPSNRILVEKEFYEVIGNNPFLKAHSPQLLGFDAESMIMMVEDLGEASDYTRVYRAGELFTKAEIHSCIDYLNRLSSINNATGFPQNLELRTLNHQHIFYLPFINDNGFDLDEIQPGLTVLSRLIKQDEDLIKRVDELGKIYLSDGVHLLHGDFYPGSLLRTTSGLRVIDPEFGFFGPAEWDIATFVAHLYIAEADPGDIREAYFHFEKPAGFNDNIFAGFVGSEIIRRLLGLAQLPLDMSLARKKELIEQALKWIKYGYKD